MQEVLQSRQVKQIICHAHVCLLGRLLAMQGPVNTPGTNYSFYAMAYMVRSLQPSKCVDTCAPDEYLLCQWLYKGLEQLLQNSRLDPQQLLFRTSCLPENIW